MNLLINTAAAWDEAIASRNGDLLQSWNWGEFKQRHGWLVERVAATNASDHAQAQILFRQRGPLSVAYIPRGPVFGPGPGAIPDLVRQIDQVCARHRAIVLYIDPDHPLPTHAFQDNKGLALGPASIQTPRTVKVPLASDDVMLAQMRKDTRHNVSYAIRHDVTAEIAQPTAANKRTFYHLLEDTSARGGFGIHEQSYYNDFLDLFGDQAVLLFTRRDEIVTSGIIAVRTGHLARSMYSGSSSAHRGRGDAALLRFAAMQWARDAGCTHYDLGGIAPTSTTTPAPS